MTALQTFSGQDGNGGLIATIGDVLTKINYEQVGGLNINMPQRVIDFKVYPNPTQDKITLVLDHQKIEEYQIIDAMGRVLLVGVGLFNNSINTHYLAAGTYKLLVKTDQGVSAATFVKQ